MPFGLERRKATKAFLLDAYVVSLVLTKTTFDDNTTSECCFCSTRSQAARWSFPSIWYMLVHAFRQNCSPPFLESNHHGGQNRHVIDPTRNRNVLELIFTVGLIHVQTCTKASLSECDHLHVSSSSILPSTNRYTPPNPRPYFRAAWNRLPILVRDFNCSSLFLTQEAQVTADQLYFNVHGFPVDLTQPHTLSVLHKTYCARIGCKLARLRRAFSKTG